MGLAVNFTKFNLTFEMIEKYSNIDWNWNYLSYNPNITIEVLKKYSDKPWNWENDFSRNMTMEIIENFPDKPWCLDSIIEVPRLGDSMIYKYPDKEWN